MNNGAVAVWLMNGDILTAADSLGRVPLEWQVAGMGDMDGVGKTDLVWRNSKTGAVANGIRFRLNETSGFSLGRVTC